MSEEARTSKNIWTMQWFGEAHFGGEHKVQLNLLRAKPLCKLTSRTLDEEGEKTKPKKHYLHTATLSESCLAGCSRWRRVPLPQGPECRGSEPSFTICLTGGLGLLQRMFQHVGSLGFPQTKRKV